MARETLEQQAMRIAQETGLDYNNVLQGLQMGDIDFQMALAPYFNYKGAIDPSIARYHGLTPEQSRGKELTLKGFSVGEQGGGKPFTYEAADGSLVSIPKEASTVNAIDRGATANTWAHEYRHQEGTDTRSEKGNRVIDLATAMTKKDWSKALNFLKDDVYRDVRRRQRSGTKEELRTAEETYKTASDVIRRNTKKNPSTQDKADLQKFLKTKYGWYLERLYGVKHDNTEKFPMNSMFKTFIKEDFDNKLKEEQAKTAKTFKEAL